MSRKQSPSCLTRSTPDSDTVQLKVRRGRVKNRLLYFSSCSISGGVLEDENAALGQQCKSCTRRVTQNGLVLSNLTLLQSQRRKTTSSRAEACDYSILTALTIIIYLCFSSLVTMKTLMVWSSEHMQHNPSRSGLQSKPTMGWVETTRELSRSTDPATPTGLPSWWCLATLLFGYRYL